MGFYLKYVSFNHFWPSLQCQPFPFQVFFDVVFFFFVLGTNPTRAVSTFLGCSDGTRISTCSDLSSRWVERFRAKCVFFTPSYLKVKINGTDTCHGRVSKGPRVKQYVVDICAMYFSITVSLSPVYERE